MSANRKIHIVGLTGGIASGKSEAAKYLESLGAHTIDADAISRSLTADGGELLPAIREAFGDGVFTEEGSLNRGELGNIVFSNPEKRKKLDALTHPAIQRAVLDEIYAAENAGEGLIFLNVPLLFETGMDVLCDESWLVSVDVDTQKERLMARDGISEEQALNRIRSQMTLEQKRERASVIIDNSRNIERMYSELQSLYGQLVKKYAGKNAE